MSTPLPSSPSLFAPVTSVWKPTHYAHPSAPASPAAVSQGQQLAATLLPEQVLYVYDHRAKQTSFVSAGVERLFGYPAAKFTTDFHYAQILPAEQGLVIEATRLVNCYVAAHLDDPLPGLLFSIKYRLRHAQGQWRHVLRQSFVLEREPNGALVAAAGVLTDITTITNSDEVQFHLNRPDFAAFVRQEQLHALPATLTTREREIAALMLDGYTNQQIREELALSRPAVEPHQRKIAQRVGSPTWYQLLRHVSAVGPEAYLGADHGALLPNQPAFAPFLSPVGSP